MRKILTPLIALIFSSTAIASNLPDFPFVVSTGSAKEEVKPDKASIHIELTSFRDSSEAALKDTNEASGKVFSLVEKFGIGEKQLEASDLQKSTKRSRDNEHNSLEILGYEVGRSIVIKLNDLSKYPDLMNQLVAIDNLSDVATSFDVSNRDAIKSRLTAKASAEAKSRAEQMARSLGVSLDSVYAISQDSDFGDFFATFGALSAQAEMAYAPRVSGGRTITFVPESIEISQGINVVFRLKD